MRIRSKAFLLCLVLAVGLFATACPERTTIGKIEANPSKYVGKDTAIAGRVTNSYGVGVLGGIYKVEDDTGSIWVVSNRGVPSKGALVGVRGEVQNGVNYAGKNYGLGMIEKDRKIR